MFLRKKYVYEAPWGVAAAVGGALITSQGAQSAASTQADAARDANASQLAMYNQTRADNAPFRDTGVAANGLLASYLGINQPTYSESQLRQMIIDEGYGKGYKPGGADGEVWDEYAVNNELKKRLDQQQQQQDVASQLKSSGAFGSLLKPFSQDDLSKDVVYNTGLQFGLEQGTNAINQRALQSGGYDSGSALKALTQFANDYGSTKANDAYNRYNTNQTNIANRLGAVSGAGQTATNQVSAAVQNMANQTSSNIIGAGNSASAAQVASGNAWNSALNTGYKSYQNNQNNDYLKSLLGGGGGSDDWYNSVYLNNKG